MLLSAEAAPEVENAPTKKQATGAEEPAASTTEEHTTDLEHKS